ncbi:MAG: D-alanyl-D-alanine carboxypeptidase, partial [Sedimentitalea sp.]|nr:D-alanyl-D-alanine carboxypeptidase [Sedimentitalea sp.]
MTARFTRRFVLAGLGAATFGGAAGAGAPEVSLRPQLRGEGFRARAAGGIEALVAGAGLSGAVVCAVADVASGLRLETLGESVG